MTVHATPASW